MLSIEVTTECNLNCINCFAHAEKDSFHHMELDRAEEIALEGRSLGYDSISLTGGEVFLWPHILDFLTFLKDIGYKSVLVNSNIHLFTDDLCKYLSEFGDFLSISCSINGFEEEHERVRGAGSYKKVLSSLKIAQKYRLRMLVYTVINRRNLSEIPKFTQWIFNEFKYVEDLVFIQQRGVDNDYYRVEDLKLTPQDLIEFVKMVAYLSLGGYRVNILENSLATVVGEQLGFQWFPKSPEISRDGKIVVLESGVITDNHSSLEVLGTYDKNSLKEILESSRYKIVSIEESRECRGCKFITICRKSFKVRPSDEFHDCGEGDGYYCQKVLSLVKGNKDG